FRILQSENPWHFLVRADFQSPGSDKFVSGQSLEKHKYYRRRSFPRESGEKIEATPSEPPSISRHRSINSVTK
ncbi:MAG: hypothetical protein WCE24_01385, partial [Pseudolabrys sp.]